ncbi:hypothetical protein B0H10DRAFT_1973550 [Mycena sp. CBHHK59/15]|nr:hypothetical protein B0H10DRAFT_1973550 [Mycena sp. CBHHK59/15]
MSASDNDNLFVWPPNDEVSQDLGNSNDLMNEGLLRYFEIKEQEEMEAWLLCEERGVDQDALDKLMTAALASDDQRHNHTCEMHVYYGSCDCFDMQPTEDFKGCRCYYEEEREIAQTIVMAEDNVAQKGSEEFLEFQYVLVVYWALCYEFI